MKKVMNWLDTNIEKVTWFIIGAMFMNAVNALALGSYGSAAVSLGLAVANYCFVCKWFRTSGQSN